MVMNEANIFFDTNDPIITNLWTNVYDDVPPVSRVNTLPETTIQTEFTISWTGTDEHAGIMKYRVYKAVNDEEFSIWLETDESHVEFEGEPGNTYKFFVYGLDWALNLEEMPTHHQAMVTIVPIYAVNYEVTGINGTLSATANNNTIYPGSAVEQESNLVFTATPDEGYKVFEWKLNGNVVEGNTSNEFVVENLQADVMVTVKFEIITSLNEFSFKESVIYPNPFTDQLYIQNTKGITRITIHDIAGREVLILDQIKDEPLIVKTEKLREGLYFIEIRFVDKTRQIVRTIKSNR